MSKDKHNYVTSAKWVMLFFFFQGTGIVVTLKLYAVHFCPFCCFNVHRVISESYYMM